MLLSNYTISTTIATIPANHRVYLYKNELFTNPEDAFIYIHNWGFTQGILIYSDFSKGLSAVVFWICK
jgi:hypothetical protein